LVKKLGFRGIKAIFENEKGKEMYILSTEYEKMMDFKENRLFM